MATWRCLRGGKAIEQFRPFLFIKMKQIIITILLAILFNTVVQKANAYDIAVENEDGVTIYYNFINNSTELQVTYQKFSIFGTQGYHNKKSVKIPQFVNYEGKKYSVTSIGAYSFFYCIDTESVVLPKTINYIGSDAFSGCTKLESIQMSESNIRYIGTGAFDRTLWYNSKPDGELYIGTVFYKYKGTMPYNTNIRIKNGTSCISGKAFENCTGLVSVDIPNSITSIQNGTFSGCSGLSSIIIPNSVTTIEGSAFEGCTGLTSITIPESVTSIGSSAFRNCSGLTSITISSNISEFGDYVFTGCNLQKVEINSNIITAKDYSSNYNLGIAFGGHVTDLVLGNKIIAIGDNAFYGFNELTSVTFPATLSSIGDGAFSGISRLNELKVSVDNHVDFANNRVLGLIYATFDEQDVSLVDGDGIVIHEYMIPNGVITIGNKSFAKCTGLTDIIIPNSVTTIGDSAFVGCSNLKSVRMGSGIKNVGYLAFGGCKKIEEVHVDDLAAWCNIDFTTEAYSSDYGVFLTSHASNPIAARVYGSGIYTGGGGATLYLQGKAVSNLKIPDGVTMIKPNVFAYSNIQTVTIPSSITTIYENAFYKCTNLNGIYINDISAWCNIDFITNFTYPAVWSRSSQEANPLIYAHNLYLNEKKVTNLSVPSGVKQIKPYAFYNCSLESVVLPNGLTTIGESAFSSCQDLKTVVIPNTVTSIGKEAFSNCMSLYSVTSLINMPFNLDESVFQYTGTQYDKNIVYMAATLYVPRGRTAMYSNVEGWKKFMNITETDTKFKLTYMLDGAVYKTYEIQATEVITPEPDPYKEHYIFSGWSEIPYLMPAQDVTITGSFTIDPEYQLSVNSVSKDDTKPAIIYSVDGRMQKTQQRGLNIIRMSDGTVRKVMINKH